jgi:hypothetical protein
MQRVCSGSPFLGGVPMRPANQQVRSRAERSPFRSNRVLTTPTAVAEGKAQQASKIREIKAALLHSGLITLDEQANALGLCRSTTFAILKGDHKASGLSAIIVNRMLSAPKLPPLVRTKILEYVQEKTSGLYGHSNRLIHKFAARIRYPIPRARIVVLTESNAAA